MPKKSTTSATLTAAKKTKSPRAAKKPRKAEAIVEEKQTKEPKKSWKRRIFWGLVLAGFIFFLYPLPFVLLLRWNEPGSTAFMERYRAAHPQVTIHQKFVPLGQIASILQEAVLTAEDDAFFDHWGVDFKQLKNSMEANLKSGRYARGGSTITMQLAKNLYLSPDKSIIRKARELVITGMLELTLSKKRILEIYLNVIEWGPGVYGIEAASRHYFQRPAKDLSPTQAATLAASISSPRKSNPAKPSARLAAKRDRILQRLKDKGALHP